MERMLPDENEQRFDDSGARVITAEHIDDSIARALRGESHLDPGVLDILGFATPTMRHLFNNLCNVEGLTYLECGTYAGATFCSAASNNPARVIGVDNFSQAWHAGRDIRAEFMANRDRFAPGSQFLEGDCFNSPVPPALPRIDIFYFDGDHTMEAQAKALPHFIDRLADTFLFIVDDYNWPDVSLGTADGFAALGAKLFIVNDWKLKGELGQDDSVWHNGVALFLCKKL